MPTLEMERTVCEETGLTLVAGLDEAGRGAIAGPVVAAAVVLPVNDPECLQALAGVNDSKQLSAKTRARLYRHITESALTYGIGSVPAEIIDEIGIIPATKRAMSLAISQLIPAAEYLLIDGRIRLQNITLPQQPIIRGDCTVLSIAAASILAKVARDRQMEQLARQYPGYGFAQHKGYGTLKHRNALNKNGPTPIHRRSFAPLRLALL